MQYVPFFYRVGQRGTGLSATIARSEHEISEIIDGLSEQEVGTNCSLTNISVAMNSYRIQNLESPLELFVC